MKPSPIKIHAALFMSSAIYAASATIAKELMPTYIGAAGFILVRVVGALFLFGIFNLLFVREKVTGWADYGRLFISAFFGVALNMIMFFKGLAITSPIDTLLIMITTPIIVLVIGFILYTEKITWLKALGVLLGTAGAVMLIMSGKFTGSGESSLKGDLFVFINAAAYGVYLVLINPLMKKYHPFTIVFWTFVFGTLFVLPVGYPEAVTAKWSLLTPILWTSVAFIIVGTTFLTYAFNGWAIKYVKPSVVGSYIYFQPLLGTLLAVSTGKYSLHWHHIGYSALIFSGVFLVSLKPKNLFSRIRIAS